MTEHDDWDKGGGALVERRHGDVATVNADDGGGAEQAMQLIRHALEQGIDPEGLQKLVQLRDHMEDREAARAYLSALRDMQAKLRPLAKNSTASIKSNAGSWSYRYTSLDYAEKMLRPLLDAHGFSYTFDCSFDERDVCTVTCYLHHQAGHTRTATFACPVDRTAKQIRPGQQSAVAMTYAKRHALLMVVGASSGEPDDDGAGLGIDRRPLTVEQHRTLKAMLSEFADPEQVEAGMCRYFEVDATENIPAERYEKARMALRAKLNDERRAAR